MMQSCASAAQLRGGGSILDRGAEAELPADLAEQVAALLEGAPDCRGIRRSLASSAEKFAAPPSTQR
jgi:hypothetical protein